MSRFAAVVASAVLALPGIAAAEDAPISNGASLDQYLAAQRAVGVDRAEWVNPLLTQAPEEVAVADGGISGDVSLDRAMAEYRQPIPDGSVWRNPHLPASMIPYDEASGSGDQVLARSVAPYTRERLDAGGWVNRLMGDEHYACGNPMLRVAPGEGVTTPQAAPVLALAE
ncbi:MAG TPA: hypothetical protein VIW03_09305 [Anaeromyxobacter sp.]